MTRRPTLPILAALACLLGLIVVGVVALAVPAGHARDGALLHGFMALDRPRVHDPVRVLVHLADPLPYALAGVACIVVALLRRRPWRALAVGVLLVVTGATTQLLKHVLLAPRTEAWLSEQIGPASWPSGHSTAAMTLALCAVLVAPPALRVLATLIGGAFAVGVGYATIVLAWHFPSDVVGGFLVAGLWTSLAVAALHRLERRALEPAVSAALWKPAIAVGAGAALGVVIAAASRPETVALYAQERSTLIVGAPAIAALGLALVALVSVALPTRRVAR